MKKKIKELLKENCFPYIHCFVYEEQQKDTHTPPPPPQKKHRHKIGLTDEKQKERSKKGYIYQTERSKKGLYLSDWQNWKKLL